MDETKFAMRSLAFEIFANSSASECFGKCGSRGLGGAGLDAMGTTRLWRASVGSEKTTSS